MYNTSFLPFFRDWKLAKKNTRLGIFRVQNFWTKYLWKANARERHSCLLRHHQLMQKVQCLKMLWGWYHLVTKSRQVESRNINDQYSTPQTWLNVGLSKIIPSKPIFFGIYNSMWKKEKTVFMCFQVFSNTDIKFQMNA